MWKGYERNVPLWIIGIDSVFQLDWSGHSGHVYQLLGTRGNRYEHSFCNPQLARGKQWVIFNRLR